MDIERRINKDMLVLSGPIEAGLARLDIDIENDLALANVLEPETIKNAIEPYVFAGAQCLVANTKHVLQSKLAQTNSDGRINDIAKAAIDIASSCKPQHIIVELGNCELPLDDMSKFSLNEFKNQYVQSCRIFDKIGKFDAYFLSGLQNISQIKCALMGIKQASDKPVIVSARINDDAMLNDNESIYDYAQTLSEFGATIAGISTSSDLDVVNKLCKRLRAGCDLPVLVEFEVSQDKSTPYFYPDAMKYACITANKAGAQFLRASGDSRPAYAAVLAGLSSQMPLNIKIGV